MQFLKPSSRWSQNERNAPALSPIALTNGTIILPDRTLQGQALHVADGVIVAICPEAQLPTGVERVDVGQRLITPGLIDIHIHGARGANFNDANEASFATVLDAAARAEEEVC